MYCGNCGARLPEGATVCEACGAQVQDTQAAAPISTAETEILPLLAAANLSRIRRQWEDATSKCIEVLRRYPNSAAAHSLLGDVYADQGLLRDAIEWYKLALELDPRNQGDRLKLDRLVKQVYGEAKPSPAEPAGQKEAAVIRLLRGARLSRPFMLAVILGLLIVIGGVSAVLISRHRGAGVRTEGVKGERRAIPQPSVASEAGGAALKKLESRAQMQYAPVAPLPPVPAPAPSPGTLITRQEQLMAHLRSLASEMPGRFTVESLSIDPRSFSCTVGFQATPAETPGQTKAELLKIAWLIARAAFQRDASLARVILRGQTILELGGDMRAPDLAVAAEIEPATIASVGSRLPGPQEILSLLRHVWWHPSLEHIPV